MAVTGTVQISVTVPAQGGLGALSLTESVSNTAAVGQQITLTLSTTPTALTIPAGTRSIIITGPAGNTVNICAGSTGVALANMLNLDPVNTTELAMPATSPVLLLAAASGTIAGVQVMFI